MKLRHYSHSLLFKITVFSVVIGSMNFVALTQTFIKPHQAKKIEVQFPPGRHSDRYLNPQYCPSDDNVISFEAMESDGNNRFLYIMDKSHPDKLFQLPHLQIESEEDVMNRTGSIITNYSAELTWCPVLLRGNQWFAFVYSGPERQQDIYLGILASPPVVFRLTDHPKDDYEPTWSPDGKTLAFISSRLGSADIYSVPNIDQLLIELSEQANSKALEKLPGVVKLLANDSKPEAFLSWTPDGKYIVYSVLNVEESNSGGSELYAKRPILENKPVVLLRDNTVVYHKASFGPDGILFTCLKTTKENRNSANLVIAKSIIENGEISGAKVITSENDIKSFRGVNNEERNVYWTKDGDLMYVNAGGGKGNVLYQIQSLSLQQGGSVVVKEFAFEDVNKKEIPFMIHAFDYPQCIDQQVNACLIFAAQHGKEFGIFSVCDEECPECISFQPNTDSYGVGGGVLLYAGDLSGSISTFGAFWRRMSLNENISLIVRVSIGNLEGKDEQDNGPTFITRLLLGHVQLGYKAYSNGKLSLWANGGLGLGANILEDKTSMYSASVAKANGFTVLPEIGVMIDWQFSEKWFISAASSFSHSLWDLDGIRVSGQSDNVLGVSLGIGTSILE